MGNKKLKFGCVVLCLGLVLTGCGKTNSAKKAQEKKQKAATTTEQTTTEKIYDDQVKTTEKEDQTVKGTATYNCNIKKDKAAFDNKIDITVGDKMFATQINDWYENFDQYEGKTVEIEGYYIGDSAPYVFVGRNGPSCPYCQGGYVSFEMLSDEDFSQYKSGEDWIKVQGILRKGEDSEEGEFYYIEALNVEKMKEKGVDPVSN